jgi:hypothetical protein
MEQSGAARPTESKWMRLLYMVLVFVFYRVAEVVLWAAVAFQVLSSLLLGHPHPRALSFGASLAEYVAGCWRYLTYNSDLKPFPFTDWPAVPAAGGGNDDSQREGRD